MYIAFFRIGLFGEKNYIYTQKEYSFKPTRKEVLTDLSNLIYKASNVKSTWINKDTLNVIVELIYNNKRISVIKSNKVDKILDKEKFAKEKEQYWLEKLPHGYVDNIDNFSNN